MQFIRFERQWMAISDRLQSRTPTNSTLQSVESRGPILAGRTSVLKLIRENRSCPEYRDSGFHASAINNFISFKVTQFTRNHAPFFNDLCVSPTKNQKQKPKMKKKKRNLKNEKKSSHFASFETRPSIDFSEMYLLQYLVFYLRLSRKSFTFPFSVRCF